jgi:hypothetical protein
MNLENKEMNVMTGRFKLMLIPVGVLILLLSGAAIIGTVYTRANGSVTTHIKPRLEPTQVSTLAEPEPSIASTWLKPQGSAVVVDSLVQADRNNALAAPQGRPLEQAGFNGKTQQAAQRELIELGFGTIEGEQFQAYVAEADDAGYGELLLQVGFTEQQIRNAQEDQREAYEEAKAKVWFQQLVSISALAELRRQGFADFQGNVNVAAAADAGLRDLLLHAGFTEGQIQDARRSITSNELSGDTFRIREEQRTADRQADLQDMLRYWNQLKQDGEMGMVP